MAKAYPRPVQGQGISREVGGADALAGLWRHPESGQSAITLDDPLFGNAQSQGFKQMGFEFVRPAEEGEIVTMPQLAAQARQADEDSLKGLSARLGALEGVAEDNKKLQAEVEELRAEKVAREKTDKEAAKAAADAAAKAKKAEKAKKADAKPAAKPNAIESENK